MAGRRGRKRKQLLNRRKGNWIGHILRRNCLLKYIIEEEIEGKVEMAGRRGRKRKQLLNRRKANWIGHILRRNCLLKYIIEEEIEGKVEMAGRRGRKRKQLLDGLKETRGYWKWKKESLGRTLWRICFGKGNGPVCKRRNRMNEYPCRCPQCVD